MIHDERGMTLSVVLITSLICSIVAYSALVQAVSQARRGRFFRTRMENRYLAEAGYVLAKERLWANPAWTPTGTEKVDTNGDQVPDTPVTITLTPCAGATCIGVKVGN
jgi:hypothetical protein